MKRIVPVRWVSSDGTSIMEGVYEAFDDGKLRLREWRGAVRKLGEKVEAAPARTKGCAGCGKGPVVTWLRIRWHGTPRPVAWWRRLRGVDEEKDWEQCGCIVKAKAAWEAVKAGIMRVRRA